MPGPRSFRRGAGRAGHARPLRIFPRAEGRAMRRLIYLLPVVLFVALAAYLAKGLTQDPHKLPSALIDKPAPEFALPGLGERKGVATTDLAGEVTLVNFFASWC